MDAIPLAIQSTTTVVSSAETNIAVIGAGAAILGAFIAGLTAPATSHLQGRREDDRLRRTIKHQRDQYLMEVKRNCYVRTLAIFHTSLIWINEGRLYPIEASDEEKEKFKSIMAEVSLIAGPQVEKYRLEFTHEYPASGVPENKRREEFDRMLVIFQKLQQAMKEELGI